MKCTYFGRERAYTGHDWVLVTLPRYFDEETYEKLLWACPCGEFRWTSYADWEKGRAAREVLSSTREQTKDSIERLTRRAWNEEEPAPEPETEHEAKLP